MSHLDDNDPKNTHQPHEGDSDLQQPQQGDNVSHQGDKQHHREGDEDYLLPPVTKFISRLSM